MLTAWHRLAPESQASGGMPGRRFRRIAGETAVAMLERTGKLDVRIEC